MTLGETGEEWELTPSGSGSGTRKEDEVESPTTPISGMAMGSIGGRVRLSWGVQSI